MAASRQKSEWAFFAGGIVVLLLFALATKILLGWISTTSDVDAGQRIKAREEIEADSAQRLQGYDWSDKTQGTVRIPIDRAVELTIAQLNTQPSRPSGIAATENPPTLSPDETYVASKIPSDSMQLGERVFTWNCSLCHQLNGQGVAGQYPPLAGSEWVLAENWHGDNHIVKIVLHGFQGPMTVNGEHFNNTMAPWGKLLTDGEIAAVLTYIRSQWGNGAPPITREFVQKIRQETKDRQKAWSQAELQAIEAERIIINSPRLEK